VAYADIYLLKRGKLEAQDLFCWRKKWLTGAVLSPVLTM
jgi:hypothetical protein